MKKEHMPMEDNSSVQESNAMAMWIFLFVTTALLIMMSPVGILIGILLSVFRKERKTAVILSIVGMLLFFLLVRFDVSEITKAVAGWFTYMIEHWNQDGPKGCLSAWQENWKAAGLVNSGGILFGSILHYFVTTESMAERGKKEARNVHLKRSNEKGEVTFFARKKKGANKKIDLAKIEGIHFGYADGEPVILTDVDMSTHCGVWGTTGSGKTETLLNIVESCAVRKIACVYVDGKGDRSFPAALGSIARKYNRPFYNFDMKGNGVLYNPIRIGDETNVRDKLIGITDWSEPHYRVNAERAVMLIVRVIDQIIEETKAMGNDDLSDYFELQEGTIPLRVHRDIPTVQRFLEKETLVKHIEFIQNEDLKRQFKTINSKLDPATYQGIETRIGLIVESKLGKLVIDDPNGLDLLKIFEENAIILFSLDCLQNRTLSEMIGRLIVNDVNTALSLKTGKEPCYGIYDEHAAYISDDIESQLSMARSFGMKVVTSTQEISDYKKSQLGEVMLEKVLGNTNVKIIMSQNSSANAELLAMQIGTVERLQKSMSTDREGHFKGQSLSTVEEFEVHPNLIKQLGVGEAAILVKKPVRKVFKKVKIKMVERVNAVEVKKMKIVEEKQTELEIEPVIDEIRVGCSNTNEDPDELITEIEKAE